MAFIRLSEAFDKLSVPENQRKHLERSAYPGRPYTRGGRYDRPPPPGWWGEDLREHGGSWWDAGFSEFEKRLRAKEEEQQRREAMEAAERRGEDSLDAFMSVLESELKTPKARARPSAPEARQEARGVKRAPSFATSRPFRVPTQPATESKPTAMADALLGHLDSDGSELDD